ncbi:MAG: DinB family protein [Caldilineales bacterium]|nr:DinB family protein [Caldilineales bacterium]
MNDRKTHIRQKMEAARVLLVDVASQIDDGTAVASTENPNWRVRDILAHVSAAEAGLLATVQRFLAGTELPPGFSLDYWNQRQVEKRAEAGVADLLAALADSRSQAWALLDSLRESDLDVVGVHPAGFRTTVAGLFYTIANHEIDHGNEMRRAMGLPVKVTADWKLALQMEGE